MVIGRAFWLEDRSKADTIGFGFSFGLAGNKHPPCQWRIGPFLPATIPSLDIKWSLSASVRRRFARPALQEVHRPEQVLLLALGHESL